MEGAPHDNPVFFKPRQPESFTGKRDFLAVTTWVFKVEQYFHLLAMIKPGMFNTDESKIMFASTFLIESAAIWWYTIVQSNSTPTSWNEFVTLLKNEFVPADYLRQAREKFRKLTQRYSASRYVSEFRNAILTLPDVTEGEKFEKFVQGLKHNVRMEVLKSTASTFEEACQIALRVDGVMWAHENFKRNNSQSTDEVVPMEIGNVQTRLNVRDSVVNDQRKKDLENNACFVCHEPGCRPWKHREGQSNNIEHIRKIPGVESSSSSDSEN